MAQYLGSNRRKKSSGLFTALLFFLIILGLGVISFYQFNKWKAQKQNLENQKLQLTTLSGLAKTHESYLVDLESQLVSQEEVLQKLIETGIRIVEPDTLKMGIRQLLKQNLPSISEFTLSVKTNPSSSVLLAALHFKNALNQIEDLRTNDNLLIQNQIETFLTERRVISLLEPYQNSEAIEISDSQINRIIRQLLNDRAFIDLIYLRINRIQNAIAISHSAQTRYNELTNAINKELEQFKKD